MLVYKWCQKWDLLSSFAMVSEVGLIMLVCQWCQKWDSNT